MHKWQALQAREDALTNGFAVGRTALQRVYDILRIKHELEAANQKSTAASIAAQFSANLALSKHSEPIAVSTIDSALTIASRVLSNPRSMAILQWCEENLGPLTPWNKIYKLQEVVSRASSPENIDWVFESITDSVRMSFIEAGDVSVRNIGDRGTKYLAGCALLKLGMRDYFLGDFMRASKYGKPGEHWSGTFWKKPSLKSRNGPHPHPPPSPRIPAFITLGHFAWGH